MGACSHPHCDKIAKRSWCARHWHALSEDLQDRWKHCKSVDDKRHLVIEAREYFEGRMIGELEIVTCRGRAPDYDGCGQNIVWMVTSNGKNMPVNADSVNEGDDIFEHKRHTAHWATCPKAQSFRK